MSCRRCRASKSTSFLLLASFLVLLVHGYDFRVTSEGGFYSSIVDDTGEEIGARFQNPVYGPSGTRIGTGQGFGYIFPNNSFIDTPNSGVELLNHNRIFYLEGGTLNVLNEAIVAGDGNYTKYTGGIFQETIVSADPNWVTEVTLIEPLNDTDAEGDQRSITFRVTGEGGFYSPILEGNASQQQQPQQIGQRFQNPVLEGTTSNQRIGTNQGYGFLFPNLNNSDTTIDTDTLLNSNVENFMGNRKFFMDDGSILHVLNEIIVHASGEKYQPYMGGFFQEHVISTDPVYVSEITFNMMMEDPGITTNGDDDNSHMLETEGQQGYHFLVSSEGGFYSPILDVASGEEIGVRFQNIVYDNANDEKVIGIAQGYGFDFPSDPYIEGTVSPGNESQRQFLFQGNRIFYLVDGTINAFNNIIVSATGAYAKYAGGNISNLNYNSDPYYYTKITLIAPSRLVHDDDEKEDDMDSSGTRLLSIKSNYLAEIMLIIVAFSGYGTVSIL